MDIFEKAKELGTMIANSPEMEKLKKNEAAMLQDNKAKTLLNDFNLLQIELEKAAGENREDEVIISIQERIIEKRKEMNEYPVTGEYIESKSNFDNLIKRINDMMIFAVTGEEPCTPDKCSTCSGGCSQQ